MLGPNKMAEPKQNGGTKTKWLNQNKMAERTLCDIVWQDVV